MSLFIFDDINLCNMSDAWFGLSLFAFISFIARPLLEYILEMGGSRLLELT